MTGLRLLFSFSGRMPRRPYWVIAVANVAFGAALALFFAALGTATPTPTLLTTMSTVLGVTIVAQLWTFLATTVKRLHDRGRSAWWLLVYLLLPSFLPSVGTALYRVDRTGIGLMIFSLASFAVSLWALIDLGFLRGTPGDNPWGPDPLAAADAVTTPSPADPGAPPRPTSTPAAAPRYDPWRR